MTRKIKVNQWIQLISILFILTLMCSCVTRKKCYKRYPPVSTVTTDSSYTRDSIVIKTYTISIPGESILLHDTIPCPELEYHREVKKNNLTAKVHISKGKMSVEFITDSLKKLIDAQSRITDHYRMVKTKEVVIPECQHKSTTWDVFCYWWFGITVGLSLLFIYFKIK